MQDAEYMRHLRYQNDRAKKDQKLFGHIWEEYGTNVYKLIAKACGETWDDEDDDGFYDHEVSMYTHFGGRLSGHGARGDSPRTVRFMHNTLKQYPEALYAYHSGKVANLSEETW